MMLHPPATMRASLARHSKRKAADVPEGNERLSKRLSLLNLEQSGAKLYIPVESPRPSSGHLLSTAPVSLHAPPASVSAAPALTTPSSLPFVQPPTQLPPSTATSTPPVAAPIPTQAPTQPQATATATPDDSMLVDDTKYKVYIYNIDDELAGASSSDSEADDSGKLVFLPDIDKHLRAVRRDPAAAFRAPVPRPILPNEDGELAGMQLVLYHDPSSLSVPREHDSVRQAILDARTRIRDRQQREAQQAASSPSPLALMSMDDDSDAMDLD